MVVLLLVPLQVSYSSQMLWYLTTRTLLNDSQVMEFSRKMLSAIMSNQRCLDVAEVSLGALQWALFRVVVR